MTTEFINDVNDERIKDFSTLRLDDKYIIAESHKVVKKLFLNKVEIVSAFVTEEYYEENKELLEDNCKTIYIGDKKVMENIIGYKLHHGVMVKALKPTDTLLENLDDRIVILNGLTSPENVGTIIRSASAFGIRSIILDEKTVSPWARRAIRVSMGNVFFMKVFHSKKIIDDLKRLKDRGYELLGTANAPISIDLPTFEFKQKSTIIIGSEGWGMDPEVYDICDHTLRIPIYDDVAHLNAAAAAAITLYEFTKSSFTKE